MLVDLVIDGNYILSKLVFTLHKNNLLYGELKESLGNAMSNFRRIYPFTNVYLASDSVDSSWRKQLSKEYKSTRKKNKDIDWSFVYDTYNEFKDELKGFKVLESPRTEGDDWISYICEKSNKEERSVFIISNDYDIKQLLHYNIDPLYINIMSNEMYNREKLFIPNNFEMFMDEVGKLPNDDVFNLNNNKKFIDMINRLSKKYDIVEVNPTEELFVKVVSGDSSDNIPSVFKKKGKSGKYRGIGEAGARGIYKKYIEEFGEVDLEDEDLLENIADIVCEKKKVSRTNMDLIVENTTKNFELIDLCTSKIPEEVHMGMESAFKKASSKPRKDKLF